ncbi:MAG: phytanoyl-CoA dioxygenase family protein [Planctomycetales bacterium]|nr:phytanoyl-CoA dioxygenase family protein [Planctomycetales bacterium]
MSQAEDLSHYHSRLTDLFDATDECVVELTPEQIEFYQREGYLSGIELLSAEQVSALREELANFVQGSHAGQEFWYEYHSNESSNPDTVLFHALGAWRIGRAFHDLLWSRQFVRVAEQLLGGPVRFWHDQLFCKPAQHGGVVAWHQDYSYWTRTAPMAHLTCWIGLDASDRENGCVQYIPRSHQWPLLPITGLAGDMNSIRDVLNDEQWEQFQTPVNVEMPVGYATFHHPLMVHGSRENRTTRPRRATVINVVRDGVCSQSNEPLLAGVPALTPGTPLGGQFFPRLSQ